MYKKKFLKLYMCIISYEKAIFKDHFIGCFAKKGFLPRNSKTSWEIVCH